MTEPGLFSFLFYLCAVGMKTKKVTSSVVKKNPKILKKIILVFISLSVIILFTFLTKFLITKFYFGETSPASIKKEWNAGNYEKVYELSSLALNSSQFNSKLLMYKGYSAFFIALSSNDTSKSLNLLDEAILDLRVVLQNAKSKAIPQIEYMLGKAYFFKNYASSYYYYADLAVKYLTDAVNHGYKAEDVYEFLGLSYASLDMTMESISSFTKALLNRESDLLLLSIGEQYYKAGQSSAAEQYLFRISQDCKDEKITEKCHILLGKIYTEQKKYKEAENEYQTILKYKEKSPDALYGLGVIYESQGDAVKARSYWRKALKLQPNHPDSLKKLAEYK